MNTIVKDVMKREKERRKALKEELLREREDIAIKVLAEAQEVIEGLKCEYLLDNPSKVEITKGKIIEIQKEIPVERIVKVEIPVEKIVEVKDEKKIAEYERTIESLNKEIEKLKKTIATMQRNQALKNNKKEIKEEVKEEMKIVVEEKKQEQNIFVNRLNVPMKSDYVKMYQTNKCYLIASERNDAITWITTEDLSDEYKKQVEEILIKEHNLMPHRIKTSPVIIDNKDSYMARIYAENNVGNKFSKNDKLSGYVYLNNRFYLYVFTPALGRVHADDFLLKLNGKKSMPSEAIKVQITSAVMKLYEEYTSECNKLIASQSKSNGNSRMQEVRNRRAAQRAMFSNASSIAPKVETVSLDNSISNDKITKSESPIVSQALQEIADMF